MRVGELYRQKIAVSVKDGVAKNSSTFVVSFHGISCAKMDSLRKDLKRKKADVLVAKTSVADIAFKEARYQPLADCLQGQMALVLSNSDASEISKILVKFAKDCEGFVLKGMLLDGKMLDPDTIKTLSALPPRNVLLAQVLGTMQAPLTRFMGALNAKTRDLCFLLKQLSEKKGGS